MRNPFGRGSAPDRARCDSQWPGSFKAGQKKLGGRKKGTPNLISADLKKALLATAYRVGSDGNGKDGIIGYFTWMGKRYPTFFYTQLFCCLLTLEEYEASFPVPPPRFTPEEINESIRDDIEFRKKTTVTRGPKPAKLGPIEELRRGSAPANLLEDLMHLAMEQPKKFCKMFASALLAPPKGWRRRAARNMRMRIPEAQIDEKISAARCSRNSGFLRTTLGKSRPTGAYSGRCAPTTNCPHFVRN
jgi:hypothetical protein